MYFLPHLLPKNSVFQGNAPDYGSTVLGMAVTIYLLHTEGLSDFVDNLVFTINHCRHGRQFARLPRFNLAHLFKMARLLQIDVKIAANRLVRLREFINGCFVSPSKTPFFRLRSYTETGQCACSYLII